MRKSCASYATCMRALVWRTRPMFFQPRENLPPCQRQSTLMHSMNKNLEPRIGTKLPGEKAAGAVLERDLEVVSPSLSMEKDHEARIRTELPGPKARALLARDFEVTSPSYPRD